MTWFIYALLSALLGSLSAIIEKRTLFKVHAIDFSVALGICAAVSTLPILFFASWEAVTIKALLIMFLLSPLAVFAFIGVTRGLRHMEISTSSPLLLLGPSMTAFLAFLNSRREIDLAANKRDSTFGGRNLYARNP